jgi:predicted dehydrogenase
VTALLIATRHNLHARQVCAGLRAGKHVFCEKPLCLHEDELRDIVRAYAEAGMSGRLLLMAGFNRRFAPMAVRLKKFISETSEPLAMHYRVNAGYLPTDHWAHDPEQGGGRLLGEVCHFIDFLCFLAGEPVQVQTRALSDSGQYSGDNLIVSLSFTNGSQGTITYIANGDKTFSKERLEVFGGGAVAVLDDFRNLELVRHGRKQTAQSRLYQDKGHREECATFAAAIRDGAPSPIPFKEIVTSTLATLRAFQSLGEGTPAAVDTSAFLQSALSPSHA